MENPGIHRRVATVLYDGRCKFCIGQIAHLRRLDRRGFLEFVSLHSPEVSVRYPDLTYEQLMEQMWVVAPEGTQFGGADALRYLSLHLPLLWPLVPFLYFPFSRPVWAWLYRLVAARRYRLAGVECDEGTCSLHGKGHSKGAG
jgi:predicted DCC family thiol-disulfide oxidoreductase YuxK